jgi:hypothetical protein
VLLNFLGGLFGLNRIMTGWYQLAIMGGLALANAIAKNKQKNREAQNAASSNENDQAMRMQQARQNALVNLLLGESNQNFRNADLDLRRREFALNAPGTRGKQALFGSLLQNLQPAELGNLSPKLKASMPTLSGGLNPRAISPQARQMGGLMQSNAVAGQQAGDQFAQVPQVNFLQGLLADPQLLGYRGPGKAESILGLLGMAGQAYGAYMGSGLGGGDTALNNTMPAPYTGLDRYGNPTNYRLPTGAFPVEDIEV